MDDTRKMSADEIVARLNEAQKGDSILGQYLVGKNGVISGGSSFHQAADILSSLTHNEILGQGQGSINGETVSFQNTDVNTAALLELTKDFEYTPTQAATDRSGKALPPKVDPLVAAALAVENAIGLRWEDQTEGKKRGVDLSDAFALFLDRIEDPESFGAQLIQQRAIAHAAKSKQ